MKWIRLTGLAIVFAAALSLFMPESVVTAAGPRDTPAVAGSNATASTLDPEPCESVCSCEGSCGITCLGNGIETCGSYGICQGMCPTCPGIDYEPVSAQVVGAVDEDDYLNNTCYYWESAVVLMHDINECSDPPAPDYYCCYNYVAHTGSPAGSCCATYGCGGSICSGYPSC